MKKLFRILTPLLLGVSLIIVSLAVIDTNQALAESLSKPSKQEYITATFGFDSGTDGWIILSDDTEWVSSVDCWSDYYDGTQCADPPYTGVVRYTVDPGSAVGYVDIYYPNFVSIDQLEFWWHRNTVQYWTPWASVYYRHSAADPWINIFSNDWDMSPAVDFSAITGTYQIRVIAGQHSEPGSFIDTVELSNCLGCDDDSIADLTIDCPNVPDANFNTPDTWLANDQATILSGTVTLEPGGIVAQNLTTFDSNTYYDVEFTVTDVVTATTVKQILGALMGWTHNVTATGTGTYTHMFQTPNLGGPFSYALENTGDGTVVIGSACFYEHGTTTSELVGCIAPSTTAGKFTDSSGWQWLRGASWNPAQNAYLPFNGGGDTDKALIISTSSYSLPTLSAGEYLLMSFRGRSDSSEITATVGAMLADLTLTPVTTDTVTQFFELFSVDYDYEADISAMAGATATLHFVNSGNPDDPTIPQGGAFLDDVCIFVSDDPAGVPNPLYLPPPDQAGNYWDFSCGDIPGILSGYGINVAPLYELYITPFPFSFWDVSFESVSAAFKHLTAILWVEIVDPVLCLVISLFAYLVNFFAWVLNIFQNWFYWILTFALAAMQALSDWASYVWEMMKYAAWQVGYALLLITDWAGLSLANIITWLGDTLAVYSDWLGISLNNMMTWLGDTLVDLSDWLGATLNTMAIWLGVNLSTFLQWVGEGLTWLWENLKILAPWLAADIANWVRRIFNEFIAAWNTLVPILNAVHSEIVDLLVRLWNYLAGWLSTYTAPALTSVRITDILKNLIISFITSSWSLFWTLIEWVWENTFAVVDVPLEFYNAFRTGMASDSFDYLLSCSGDEFWCQFLAGFQLVNQASSHTVTYPMVIVGIIVATVVILWRDIVEWVSIKIS